MNQKLKSIQYVAQRHSSEMGEGGFKPGFASLPILCFSYHTM